MSRIIFHIDMDAFFAACEIRQRPELRDKPVVVGADPRHGKGRGVVSTCNYAARAFGINSGMPISESYRLCPNAAYLPVNFSLYWNVSDNIMQLLRRYADKFQQTSIDEAFMDVTSRVKDYEEATGLADRIKKEIAEKEKLTCSIGIGPNKLIAKIASDINKPDGVTVVRPEEVKEFLFPSLIRKLYGVGKKTSQVLNEMGIETIGDLAKQDVQILQGQFGRFGIAMHNYANGVDDSEVEEEYGVKSVGREITFEEDTNDFMFLNEAVDRIAGDLCSVLAESGYSFRTVTLKLRYENFETHTHQKTLPRMATELNAISGTAKELLGYFLESKKKIRLIGIRLSNMKAAGGQKTLKSFG